MREKVLKTETKKVFDTNLISEVVASSNLEEAFQHVYKKRKKYHHNNDIWHLSANWDTQKTEIQDQLLNNSYHIEPIKIIKIRGEPLSVWGAKDAVVLKAISVVLSKRLNHLGLNKDVYHLSGNGGVKGATNKVAEFMRTTEYKHIIKSDIESFYATSDHHILLKECKKYIKDKKILNIIKQYAARLEDVNGEYKHITKGISKGCSLSPLMGAIILKSLDKTMTASKNIAYLRYMDDWVIITKTKAQLRKYIKLMHKVINKLKFKLALDKTFIGKLSRGFVFLGHSFDGAGTITKINKTIKTIKNIINYNNNKTTMLYEHYVSVT